MNVVTNFNIIKAIFGSDLLYNRTDSLLMDSFRVHTVPSPIVCIEITRSWPVHARRAASLTYSYIHMYRTSPEKRLPSSRIQSPHSPGRTAQSRPIDSRCSTFWPPRHQSRSGHRDEPPQRQPVMNRNRNVYHLNVFIISFSLLFIAKYFPNCTFFT